MKLSLSLLVLAWRLCSLLPDGSRLKRVCDGSSGSDRNTCSPGKAVGLTCSESDDVRLVRGDSRCAGTLEVKQGDWRPERERSPQTDLCGGSSLNVFTLDLSEGVCNTRLLSLSPESHLLRWVESAHHQTVIIASRYTGLTAQQHLCVLLHGRGLRGPAAGVSDLLLQPNISVSSSMDGVSEAQQQGFQVLRGSNFTISCSIQPQYPGGSFQLTFTSSNSTHNYTQPAVNHSAYFLFPEAEPAHQGSYSCVYHLYVFSHNFSSESRLLSVTVSDPTPFIIRAVVLPLILLLENIILYFYCKASRGQRVARQENIELDYYNLGVAAAEGGLTEEEGAQGAE
ncbi:uncharacterized protein LOC126395948 [Epinephelus moara]|uniref:uncharacterized protein LOC126395948 n=1 Tax=Epinephelus moara TaxID=300413 RepID=UPI00214EF4C2|nr:uncharacterized protein LOC126395948 [Epinephelus moara]